MSEPTPNDGGARAAAIDAACVRQAFDHARAVLVSTSVLAIIVAFVLAQHVPAHRLWVWEGLLAAMLLVRFAFARSFAKRAPSDAELGPFLRAHAITLALSSLLWGCLIFLPARRDDAVATTVVLLFTGGHCAGASQSLIGTPRTFAAILVGLLGPALVVFFTSGVPEHLYIGLTVLVYLAAIANIARKNHRLLQESIALRFGNLDLVERLTAEKVKVEAARDEAERATHAKDQFLAAASHDIRQPVHAAFLFLGALEHRIGSAHAELIAGLRASLGTARQMLDALLDVSKLDAGVVERMDAQVSAAALAEGVRAVLAPVAARKGLSLRVRAPQDLWLQTDATLCHNVLINLVSNALKYTSQGGVLLSLRRKQDHCLLQVWDTGIGISPADYETIFEPFQQLGNPQRDTTRGIGLGLFIVRRICRVLGTNVLVRSQPGRGSVFSMRLPLAAPPPAESTGPVLELPAPLVRRRLLVVEDSSVVREALSALLTAWGYDVTAVADLRGVAAALERGSGVDLIVVDQHLAGDTSGLDAVRSVEAHLGRRVPAIVITGDTSKERILEAKYGPHPVIFKPVPPDELRAALSRALDA